MLTTPSNNANNIYVIRSPNPLVNFFKNLLSPSSPFVKFIKMGVLVIVMAVISILAYNQAYRLSYKNAKENTWLKQALKGENLGNLWDGKNIGLEIRLQGAVADINRQIFTLVNGSKKIELKNIPAIELSPGQTIEQAVIQTVRYWINNQQPTNTVELSAGDKVLVVLRVLKAGDELAVTNIFKEASISGALEK